MQVNERAYTSTNSNSKWFLELNIKCETIKNIQETVRENLYDNKFCDKPLDSTISMVHRKK